MGANEEMVRYWNTEGATRWIEQEEQVEAMLTGFVAPLLEAAAVGPGQHVLDVGCGAGPTTLALARAVGPEGRVMGLDVSRPMLDLLAERASRAGLGNVIVREADAQVAPLPAGHFDVVVSRFGVMFFDDPVAAFTNLARATKPGGRLAFVCWQGMAANPWLAEPAAIARRLVPDSPPPTPGAPGPFAFADRRRVETLLDQAGFVAIRVEPLTVELDGGPPEDLARFCFQSAAVQRTLGEADEGVREQVRAAILADVERHQGDDGRVRRPGAAWLVTARR